MVEHDGTKNRPFNCVESPTDRTRPGPHCFELRPRAPVACLGLLLEGEQVDIDIAQSMNELTTRCACAPGIVRSPHGQDLVTTTTETAECHGTASIVPQRVLAVPNIRQPPLNERLVRLALNYATSLSDQQGCLQERTAARQQRHRATFVLGTEHSVDSV
jgi:hypothetical protein